MFGSGTAGAGGFGGFGASSSTTVVPASNTGGFGMSSSGGGGGGFGTASSTSAGFGTASGLGGGFAAGGGGDRSGFGGSNLRAPTPTMFGSSTTSNAPQAAAPAFGSFAVPQQQQQQQQAMMSLAPSIAGHMLYEELSPAYQQQIDALYEAIRNHQRAMETIRTNDMRHEDLKGLQQSVQELLNNTQLLEGMVQQVYDAAEKGAVQSVSNCVWPLEAAAAHRGLVMPSSKANTNDSSTNNDNNKTKMIQAKLLQDCCAGYIDRLERMPPYIVWECIQNCEERLDDVRHQLAGLCYNMEQVQQWTATGDFPIQTHFYQVQSLHATAMNVHLRMKEIRNLYAMYETGENVLSQQQLKRFEKERQYHLKVQSQYLQVATTTTTTAPPPAAPAAFGFGTTPAPAFGFSAPAAAFGSATPTAPAPAFGAPAPATFGFGAPAPAPAALGGFGAPTPAPATFGGFGAPTAPAPAFGGFGAPTAPAPAFGAFGAPAPAFGSTTGFSFGAK